MSSGTLPPPGEHVYTIVSDVRHGRYFTSGSTFRYFGV